MNQARVRHFAEYLLVRIVVCVLQTLRPETFHTFARFMARLCSDVLRIRAAVIDENLQIAFPEWTAEARRACARRMWEHLFLFVAEVVQAPRKIHVTNYRDYVVFANEPEFARLMFDDRPTIFLTAHFGVFEMLGFFTGLVGFPSYTIVRTLDNPYLEKFLAQFRGATGQHLIAKEGATEQINEVLQRAELLGILADQYAGQKGLWVNFFGKPASTHKAIALLALTQGVRLAVATERRRAGPMTFLQILHAEFDPQTAPPEMLTPKAVTQWFTTEFEKFIRTAPEQYWWLHRRWKDNRKKKSAAVASSP